MKHSNSASDVIILTPEQGRIYHLGPMTAVIKADENETDGKYGISEWVLEPNMEGPHVHKHEDKEHIFYVLEGTMSVFITDKWEEAEKGTFIRISQNTLHTFANRTDKKASFLNIDIPGGFEKDMYAMEEWFKGK